MTPSITVIGGAGGTTAETEDLLAMTVLLQVGSQSVKDVVHELSSPAFTWILAVGADQDLVGSLELSGELAALTAPFGLLEMVIHTLDTLAARLIGAAVLYAHTEHSVLDAILGGLGDLGLGAARLASGQPIGGLKQVVRGLPGLTDLATLSLGPVEAIYALAVPDGRPVLRDLGTDDRPEARLAPRTIADLVAELAMRNSGRPGEISVSFIVGADGCRRAIVDIPGTKSWNPLPSSDVTSVGTDLHALAGQDTSYEEGIFAAMTAAGVGRDVPVMLVGHSEGGIVAVNAARDAARSGRFRITHVVTAGSPIGRVVRALPSTVQVLALENRADLVPDADGTANPDRPNIITVRDIDEHYSPVANHDLTSSYLTEAEAADNSDDVSIDAFVDGARHFLDGVGAQTGAYWITRER